MNQYSSDIKAEPWIPHSTECETEILGSILANPEIYATVQLHPDHFYESLCGRIFNAIGKIIAAGQRPSLSSVAIVFADDAAFNEMGGPAFLAKLMGDAPIPMMVPRLGEIIRDLAARREMTRIFEEAVAECVSPAVDLSADQIASRVNEQVVRAGTSEAGQKVCHISAAVDEAWTAANNIFGNVKDPARIDLGMVKLEKLTGGVRRGDCILVGGRPGMGKTAFGLAIAASSARRGHKTLIISLEMTSSQIGARHTSSEVYPGGPLEYTRLRSGPVTDKEVARIGDVHEGSRELSLWLDARSGLNMAQVQATVAYQRIKTGLDLVVIDYLGLIQSSERNSNRTRNDEIGEVSKALKTMAMQNDICVIAMHQLSRAAEKRDNQRPLLSDLRDSGNLEQDADMVWFPFREAYYLQSELESADDKRAIEIRDRLRAVGKLVEVIVAKNRHGQTGTVRMYCDIASNVIADENPSRIGGLDLG